MVSFWLYENSEFQCSVCWIQSCWLRLPSWMNVRDSAIQGLQLSILLVAKHPFPPFLNFWNGSENASDDFLLTEKCLIWLCIWFNCFWGMGFNLVSLLFWPLNYYNNATMMFFFCDLFTFSVSCPKYAAEVVPFLSAVWIIRDPEWNILKHTKSISQLSTRSNYMILDLDIRLSIYYELNSFPTG